MQVGSWPNSSQKVIAGMWSEIKHLVMGIVVWTSIGWGKVAGETSPGSLQQS